MGLKIQTDNLPSDAPLGTPLEPILSLNYPATALRIWKSPPGQTPNPSDQIEPNRQYTVSELGTSLSIQSLSGSQGKVVINLSCGEISDDVLVNLLPVDIVPDDDMAGVIGDEVKPVRLSSPIKHFVTPKQTIEINQPHVILKAAGVTADQITPGYSLRRLAG